MAKPDELGLFLPTVISRQNMGIHMDFFFLFLLTLLTKVGDLIGYTKTQFKNLEVNWTKYFVCR